MRTLNRYLVLLSTLTLLSGCGGTLPLTFQDSFPSSESRFSYVIDTRFRYEDYAEVLKTYVNDQGLVDYARLQKNRQPLDQFTQQIDAVSPKTYQSWSDSSKIAFLINAYNAFTLQAIIDETPLKSSIREISGIWKWRKFPIVGTEKTLDNIEHDILRQDFNEPRIHFALVCAAKSCPPLRNEPYTSEKLDQQLDEQVQKFLESPHGFSLDKQQGKVYLSSIFQWFGEDWTKSYGVKDRFTGNENEQAVLNFLSRYLSVPEQVYLSQGNYKIAYLDYDWSLNKQ